MELSANDAIKHKITSFEEYVLIEFECGILTNDMLYSYQAPDPVKFHFSNKGVIIKGQMPLWFCAYLTHAFHATRFVAIYEPRILSAIVVTSHTKEYKAGELIKLTI